MKTNMENQAATSRVRGISGTGGFTLIEIMMVVAIIGLTLSMGIPSFRNMLRKEGMAKAELDMVKACQAARQNAIMNNKDTVLVIRPKDRTFSVPGAFDAVTLPNDVDITVLGVNFNKVEDEPEADVHFKKEGTSDEFMIVFHGFDGSYRTIYLDCVTALVRSEGGIFDPYKR